MSGSDVDSVVEVSDVSVVGGDWWAGSNGGGGFFLGSTVHSLVSCCVLQQLRHPILGIGVTVL